jgi:predicted amidohydrolase
MPITVAVIQRPPGLLDRKRTIAQALASIDEAAQAAAARHVHRLT